MSEAHRIAAIVPARDLTASTDFYERLGLTVTADQRSARAAPDHAADTFLTDDPHLGTTVYDTCIPMRTDQTADFFDP